MDEYEGRMTDGPGRRRVVTFPGGRQVCALGLGTWHIGLYRSCHDDEVAALRRGIELGLEVVDTAEMYGNETLIGEALDGLRDRVFLVGKVLPEHADYKGTMAACERSLRRLRTDHFDLYLLHWSGPYPIEETVRAMTRLVADGKIGMWGVSNMDVGQMERFFSFDAGAECATDQVLYNLSCRGIEYDLLPWCDRHHIPVMAYSPMLQGGLLDNPVLRRMAEDRDATVSQIALAWTMRGGRVLPIPKCGTVRHVEDNFKALDLEFTDDELDVLNRFFPAPSHKQPLEKI